MCGLLIADIGCGSNPHPTANVLVDLYPGETIHRQRALATDGKRLVVASVEDLPFPDKYFDFVFCRAVLEHTEDPVRACAELNRVGKAGEVTLPLPFSEAYAAVVTPGSDIGHRWLCWRDRDEGFYVLKCDLSRREEYLPLLTRLGLLPDASIFGYAAEARMGWGYGEWPDVLGVTVVTLKGETDSE